VTRTIVRSAATLAICVALPTAAYGQSPKASAADETADTLFKEGLAALKAGNSEKARADFLAAYGIEKTPSTLWNLALSEKEQGLYLDALRHFRRWLGDWTPKTKPLNSRDLATKYVGDLKLRTGHVTFEGQPPTTLKIDGLEVTLVDEGHPLEVVDVMPGHHVIAAEYGSRTLRQDIEFAAGMTTPLHLEPEAAPPVAATPPNPAENSWPAAGPRPESPATSQDSGSSHGSARTWVPLTLVGGAVVLGGLGVYFGAQSSSSANSADQLRNSLPPTPCPAAPGCAALKSDVDSAHTDHVASIVFYSVGAAALVGGAVSYLLLREPKEKASVAAPLIAPGTLGAQWITSF
jgi:hypothetical protein